MLRSPRTIQIKCHVYTSSQVKGQGKHEGKADEHTCAHVSWRASERTLTLLERIINATRARRAPPKETPQRSY